MTYPKFKHKHREKALFSPSDFIDYIDLPPEIRKALPKKYILIYDRKALNYFKRKYKPKKINILKLAEIYAHNNVGLVNVRGIGSPHAVTVIEELIGLGGREFLNIGTAGGLQHQGLFLCNKALRDEGTSYHYIPHGHYSFPDKGLTERLRKSLEKNSLEYSEGTTWTIDAPYRETKAEIEKYRKQGIATVEMEASALFAVAKFRKVKIAGAFVVSDVLGKKWEPNFHRLNVIKTLNKLVDASVDCLGK